MRRVAVFVVVVAGCGAPASIEHPDIVADMACEMAYAAVRISAEIAPAPASDKCENCDGTGRIGDGRVIMTCPVCRGTGKKDRSVLCTTGSCQP